MNSVTLEEAQDQLPELLVRLSPGEQLVITKDGEPLATLIRQSRTRWPCRAGSAKNTNHWMAPDFDAPLEDFREYMG